MTKQEFLAQLRKGLSGLPQNDREERLTFISEMIDDRMEEGLSEEEAVAGIGSVDELVAQIVAETPLSKLVKEKMTPKRRLAPWEIAALVLGAPLWLSLLAAALSVIVSLYAALWSLVVSLWAVFASLVIGAVGGVAAAVVAAFGGNPLAGLAILGCALAGAGLSVFLFFGCRAASKGALSLAKKITLGIKNRFMNKEEING